MTRLRHLRRRLLYWIHQHTDRAAIALLLVASFLLGAEMYVLRVGR